MMMLLLVMAKRENDDNTAKTWTEMVTCNEPCSSRVTSKQVCYYLPLSRPTAGIVVRGIVRAFNGFCPQHHKNEQIMFNEKLLLVDFCSLLCNS